MDSARCALRLGAVQAAERGEEPPEVHIVYRRSHEEVPARAEEVHHAEEEGIIFDFLTNPVEIYGDDKGQVTGMRCIRMELGEPDASGRRRPIPVDGSEFDMDVDTVVMALGTRPNPLIFTEEPGSRVRRTESARAGAHTLGHRCGRRDDGQDDQGSSVGGRRHCHRCGDGDQRDGRRQAGGGGH